MNIQGLQKLTLLDFPGHTACTVFTGGCNLRCPFCHNVPLVLDPTGEEGISTDEFFEFLSKRHGLLDGVAVTGGEPLLQPDLEDFLKRIKDSGFAVKLDTNGAFSERLMHIISSGLVDYIAMDIKNTPSKYAITSGVENAVFTPFGESIDLIMASGVDYEFRTTVVDEFHTVDDIAEIGEIIKGAKRYFLQAFKDSGILSELSSHAASEEKMNAMLRAVEGKVQTAEIRGM